MAAPIEIRVIGDELQTLKQTGGQIEPLPLRLPYLWSNRGGAELFTLPGSAPFLLRTQTTSQNYVLAIAENLM
jgi:hypothetical protein